MNQSITVMKYGLIIKVDKKRGEMNRDLYKRAWYMIGLMRTMSYQDALVQSSKHIYKLKGCVY